MGKLLFTNNQDWENILRGIYSKNELNKNYSSNGLTCYAKRYVDSENCYFDNDGVVAIIGTWAYLNDDNPFNLNVIYQDLKSEDKGVDYVRKHLIGSYALAYIQDNKLRIFVDECHTYALYYYIGREGVVVTNTYYHVEKASKQEFDETVFATMLASVGLCSNRTPFKNIYRLLENEYIEYDFAIHQAIIKKCDVHTTSYSFGSMEEALKVLKDEIELQTTVLNKRVHKKFLFATGGLDSRVKLALDLFHSKEVMIGYWKGEDSITNGTLQDAKINELLASEFSLKTKIFDVSQHFRECLRTIDEDELDRYGEYISIYAHNQKWLTLFDDLHKENIDEVEFGMDTDLLREIGSLDDSFDEDYDNSKFAIKGCLRGGLFNYVFDLPNVCKLICDEIKLVNLDSQNDLKTKYANLFNYFRHDMGCYFSNMLNESFFSYPLLHSKRIWDIIYNIPYDYREDSKLSLRLINSWCPMLLNIPVFTHHHYGIYNRQKGVLKKNWRYSLLLRIKPYVLRSKLYDILYVKLIEPVYRPQNKNNEILFQTSVASLQSSESFIKSGVRFRKNLIGKGFDMAALCTIVAKCKFVDQVLNVVRK